MPMSRSGEAPRPPARHSLQFGESPLPSSLHHKRKPQGDGGTAAGPKADIIAGVPGYGTLNSATRSTMHPSYAASAASLMASQSFPSGSAAAAAAAGHVPAYLPNSSPRISALSAATPDSGVAQGHLRGRLNEGTLHRIPQVSRAANRDSGSTERGGRSALMLTSTNTINSNGGGPHTARVQPAGRLGPASPTHTARSGRGPAYGPSVVSWVQVSPGNAATQPGSAGRATNATSASLRSQSQPGRADAATATAAVARMVRDASVRNTWAMRFASTAALRAAVHTDHDAFTRFEDALTEELNALRRAPADYAAVVEREATVAAPYVRDDDVLFTSEIAAEEAGALLRRVAEQEAASEVAAAAAMAAVGASAAAAGGASSATRHGNQFASASSVAAKQSALGSSVHATSGPATSAVSPAKSDRRKAGKKGTGNQSVTIPVVRLGSKDGAMGDSQEGPVKADGQSSGRQSDPGTPHAVVLPATPLTPAAAHTATAAAAAEARELTLAELRHAFRCQQRYRAALESGVRELRVAQRQAEAAQLAAWAAEDERSHKRARRSMASSMAASTAPGYSVAGSPGGSGSGKKLSVPSARRSSPATDENIFLRRSAEAAHVHRAYEQQVQRLEAELQKARSACQRTLAGGNVIASAVRALRAAKPVPELARSRGLGLAARDTAEVYYGDAERVAALAQLYAVSRASLFALSDMPPMYLVKASGGGASGRESPVGVVMPPADGTAPRTLEALASQLGGPRRCSVPSPGGADSNLQHGSSNHTTTGKHNNNNNNGGDSGGGGVSAAGVLPVLSEEATLFGHVARTACTTYGYISNEIRGVHLQGIGSPRTLLLQFIVGALTPVVDITNRPGATAAAAGAGSRPSRQQNAASDLEGSGDDNGGGSRDPNTAATQCYAGVRIEGQVYAAAPASGDGPSTLHEQVDDDDDFFASVFGAKSDGVASPTQTAGADGATNSSSGDAAQRLWPLLWSGASSVGCGWQQVRGWRPVPCYAAAHEEQRVESVALLAAQSPSAPPPTAFSAPSSNAGSGAAVICATLLFASGFEEYEAVRACSGMTPAATRRAVLGLPPATHEEAMEAGGFESGGGSVHGRRAAVEVHSRLGVTLLTPTMHPIVVPVSTPHDRQSSPGAGGPSGTHPRHHHGGSSSSSDASAERQSGIVCVAVRVPHAAPAGAPVGSSTPAAEMGSVRVVAQVTRQSDATPLWPSVSAAEVLAQRSPADPTVWVVLVDTAAAFARFSEGAKTTERQRAAPLAVHLFAKDTRDVTGGYEHVAFIRLQQGSAGDEGESAAGGTGGELSSLLIAPEWRYLLDGLSCLPSTVPGAGRSAAAAAGSEGRPHRPGSGGWAVLHEPLLGRQGVVLHPLCNDLRAANAAATAAAQASATGMRGAQLVSDDAVHVAVQLPAHANLLWWHRRLCTLRAARDRLVAEVAAETEAKAEVKAEATEGGAGDAAVAVDAALPVADRSTASTVQSATPPQLSSPTPPSTPPRQPNGAAAKPSANARPAVAKTGGSRKRSVVIDAAEGGAGGGEGRAAKQQQGGRNSPSKRVSVVGTPTAAAGRRGLSFHLPSGPQQQQPEVEALREYEARVAAHPNAATAATPVMGVHACLQPAHITLAELRGLHGRLRDGAQAWQAYVARLQPFLDSERERVAGEAARRKGKEQQRVQHDQGADVTRELAEVTATLDAFQQAAAATYAALRKRERGVALRAAQLARVEAELATLESTPSPTAAIMRVFHGDEAAASADGAEAMGAVPPPRVALRLFSASAVVVGSGRNAAAVGHGGRQQPAAPPDVLTLLSSTTDGTEAGLVFPSGSEARCEGLPESVVAMEPQHGASTLPGAVVYAASCTVPRSFTGQAALLIDDEVAVTWTV